METVLNTVTRSIPNRNDLLADAYQYHARSLKSYLMRTVDEADAEDLMHDVYLRMAGHSDLGVVDNLKAFMFTTATNLLRDRWRRANAHYAPTLVEWRESLTRVHKEMGRLPTKSRRAFELNRMGGFSYADIADMMMVSVSMIEKHISLTLNRLRIVL